MSIKNLIRKWLLDDQPEAARTTRTLGLQEGPPSASETRQFTITEALNGKYITFQKRKYNPSGPDEFRHEVYLVQSDESLIDAISTVLVLTER
jgi:hypothetical protein